MADTDWLDRAIKRGMAVAILKYYGAPAIEQYAFSPATYAGEGKGNWGHAGRPGQEGGSAPSNQSTEKIDLKATRVPLKDRFPDLSTDKAPGGKYEYHSTPATKLSEIVKVGLTGRQISVSPHLNSAAWWGEAIDSGTGNVYLLRMARESLKKEGLRIVKPPDDNGTPIPDTEETREHWIQGGNVSPGVIEIYVKGRWEKIRSVVA